MSRTVHPREFRHAQDSTSTGVPACPGQYIHRSSGMPRTVHPQEFRHVQDSTSAGVPACPGQYIRGRSGMPRTVHPREFRHWLSSTTATKTCRIISLNCLNTVMKIDCCHFCLNFKLRTYTRSFIYYSFMCDSRTHNSK